MTKLLVASHNTHKMNEFKAMFEDLGIEIISLSDLNDQEEVIEDGHTFMENATKKARHFANKHNIPTLADDSGLCVDALGGMPGIYSARYSGKGDQANNAKLLLAMEGQQNRKARFVAAIVLVLPDGTTYESEAFVEGLIHHTLAGHQGFGYDPLFYVPELGQTFGQTDPNIKHQMSHRGKALRNLKEIIHEVIDHK